LTAQATFTYSLPGGSVVLPHETRGISPLPKLAVTRTEAANMLSICEKTLDRLASSGRIRKIEVKRRVIFSMEDIEAFLRPNVPASSQAHAAGAPDCRSPVTVDRQEAARLLAIGVRLFDKIVDSGEIPKILIQRKIIFLFDDLVCWLRKQPNAGVSD